MTGLRGNCDIQVVAESKKPVTAAPIIATWPAVAAGTVAAGNRGSAGATSVAADVSATAADAGTSRSGSVTGGAPGAGTVAPEDPLDVCWPPGRFRSARAAPDSEVDCRDSTAAAGAASSLPAAAGRGSPVRRRLPAPSAVRPACDFTGAWASESEAFSPSGVAAPADTGPVSESGASAAAMPATCGAARERPSAMAAAPTRLRRLAIEAPPLFGGESLLANMMTAGSGTKIALHRSLSRH